MASPFYQDFVLPITQTSHVTTRDEWQNASIVSAKANAEQLHEKVYLDSAATTKRLNSAIEAMSEYYTCFNANVHRGAYKSAQMATDAYERARLTLATFIGANDAKEIVFTSGATLALNIIANGLTRDQLHGNKIVLCISEHHANLLPWQHLANKYDLTIQAVYVDQYGRFGEKELTRALSYIDNETALVAFAHVSNVLGNIYPVQQICSHAASVNAISVIDGTQAGAHIPIDVAQIACDFYVLSGHKMYASTGIGVLYGKFERLAKLQASILGGEMIKEVTLDSHLVQAPPLKFEAGTPNIAGALSMAKAAQYCMQNQHAISNYERELYTYLYAALERFEQIQLLGNKAQSISLISFVCKGVHAYDLATTLSTHSIAVRAGHHCAMPLLKHLKLEGCVRVSLACYNSKADVDAFINGLTKSINQMQLGEDKTSSFDISVLAFEKQLSDAKNWNEKHRLLLLQSKQLPILAIEERVEAHEVSGCESKVWLCLHRSSMEFSAYSDSKIIRGLLSVLLNKANSMSIADKLNVNFNEYLQSLGLTQYFSQGRKDGIQQVIRTIEKHLSAACSS